MFSGYNADADYLIERLHRQMLDIQHKYHTVVMPFQINKQSCPRILEQLVY